MRHLRQAWAVARGAAALWLECNAFSHAGALAFYTLFSLAPVVIIAVTIVGLVLGEQAAQGQIVGQLQDLMGAEAAAAVEQAVVSSRVQQAGWLPTLLGAAAMIVGATTVFAQMQQSLNAIWGVAAQPTRSGLFVFVKTRLLSLTVVLAIGLVLLATLVAGIALRAVLHFTHQFVPAVAAGLGWAELLLSWLTMWLLFAVVFKVLPDVVLRWRDVLAGALVTALLFSVGKYAIALYLTYTATASTYGAAGSVVLILLWVYYSSLILFYGAACTRTQLRRRGLEVMPRNSAVGVRQQVIDAPVR
jgi:membrane protein